MTHQKLNHHVRDYVKHRKVFNTTRQSIRNEMCVYCETKNHRTAECPAVCDVAERRQVLVNKRLCFNCTKPDHRASSCPSNKRCRKCSRKHHTSICTAGNESHEAMESDTKGKAMTASVNCEGLLPIVVVTINGVQCQALIDCGAGSSYASHTILNMLNLKPFKTEFKTIEMMLTSKPDYSSDEKEQRQLSYFIDGHEQQLRSNTFTFTKLQFKEIEPTTIVKLSFLQESLITMIFKTPT